MGVLQRIAIAYGLSSIIIIHFNFKQIMQIIFGILLSYWALLFFGAGNDPYSISENIIRKFDILYLENLTFIGVFKINLETVLHLTLKEF